MRPNRFTSIVILTGAGVSAESGLATFRAENGLWCSHRIEDVATPEGFARDPARVQQFYNRRRAQLAAVNPNAAHHTLARLAEEFQGSFLLVTQNVDNLHERAFGRRRMSENFRFVHMHGELARARCVETGMAHDWAGDIAPGSLCPCCHETGTLRPHIVWFGEMPFDMPLIYEALEKCDLFVSIGTSGNVYPAAGFVAEARASGRAYTIEINLEPSETHSLFHETRQGKATDLVPRFAGELLDA
jgi:NAD-dependent deacetylase